MGSTVVCGVDGSEESERALVFAVRLCQLLGLTLVPVYAEAVSVPIAPAGVAPLDGIGASPLDYEEASRAARAGLEEMLARHGVDAPLRGGLGAATEVIVEAAAEEEAELAVVGSVGHGALASAILGSVSMAVAARAPCPVVVVPRRARLPERVDTIVCGVDASDEAAAIRDVAQRFCDRLGARLELVHVAPPPQVPGASAVPGGVERVAEAEREDARRHLEGLAGAEAAEQRVALGPPAAPIVEAARVSGAGLIVVGSHGRGPVKAALLGSVSRDVIRDAPCPVVVVPPSAT